MKKSVRRPPILPLRSCTRLRRAIILCAPSHLTVYLYTQLITCVYHIIICKYVHPADAHKRRDDTILYMYYIIIIIRVFCMYTAIRCSFRDVSLNPPPPSPSPSPSHRRCSYRGGPRIALCVCGEVKVIYNISNTERSGKLKHN